MTVKVCPRCLNEKPVEEFGLKRRMFASGIKMVRQSYCKPCRVAAQMESERRNPSKARTLRRRMKLQRNYGITPEQHADQLVAQGYCCAICRKSLADLSPQTVHVDHCHESGRLRGILCGPCNTGLGNFRDNEASLMAAIEYLRAGGTWVQSTHSEPMGAKLKQVAA